MCREIISVVKAMPLRMAALLLATVFALCAHGAVWESRVVDAVTGRPLAFASVKATGGRSTITNVDGWFKLVCDSAESVDVSFVGYSSVTVRPQSCRSAVALQPMSVQLAEVVVMPVDKIVKAVTAEARRQMKKKRRLTSTFFYRQMSSADGECIEVLEAFFKGKPVVTLRDLSLAYGRYAALKPDSTTYRAFFGNFFTYSQLELVGGKEPDCSQDVMPLVDNFAEYYDVGLRVISDGKRRLFVLIFRPRPEVARPILECELYVDTDNYHILRCKGKGLNMRVLNTVGQLNVVSKVDKMEFDANYTDADGYSELLSVSVQLSFEFNHTRSSISSLLFNVGNRMKLRHGRYMLFFDKLQNKIDRQGYDADFWRKNEIVKRTPLEEEAVKMFEHRNLFGAF